MWGSWDDEWGRASLGSVDEGRREFGLVGRGPAPRRGGVQNARYTSFKRAIGSRALRTVVCGVHTSFPPRSWYLGSCGLLSSLASWLLKVPSLGEAVVFGESC